MFLQTTSLWSEFVMGMYFHILRTFGPFFHINQITFMAYSPVVLLTQQGIGVYFLESRRR
jgi:hypothetical protein